MTFNYRTIADELTRRIAAGEFSPGARMPPQHMCVNERGIAGSTASRVYDLLERCSVDLPSVYHTSQMAGQPDARSPAPARETWMSE